MIKFDDIEHLIEQIAKLIHTRDNNLFLGKNSELSADIAMKKDRLGDLLNERN